MSEFMTTCGTAVVETVLDGATVEVRRSRGHEDHAGDVRRVRRVSHWPEQAGRPGEWYVHLDGAGFELGGPGSELTWRVADG